MKLLYSPRFRRQYRDAPLQVQKAFDKQAIPLGSWGNSSHTTSLCC